MHIRNLKCWMILSIAVMLIISGCTFANSDANDNQAAENHLSENTKGTSETDEEIMDLATTWANALKTRDGKPRYEMMSDKAQEKFEQEQIEKSGEDWNYNIGYSSPWVINFEIIIDNMTAVIDYVTQTSEPAYYLKRETVTFVRENGNLVVDDYDTNIESQLIEEPTNMNNH